MNRTIQLKELGENLYQIRVTDRTIRVNHGSTYTLNLNKEELNQLKELIDTNEVL